MDDAEVWRLFARLAAERKTLDTAGIAARVPVSRRPARRREAQRVFMMAGALDVHLDPHWHEHGHDRRCETCFLTFHSTRSDARYCSTSCRVKAYRSRQPAQQL